MKMTNTLIIIGSGPAGLMTAVRAAQLGIQPLVLEKMKRPGLKLSISGHGRGNLSNDCRIKEFLQAFGEQGQFLKPALKKLSPQKLRKLLVSMDLPTEIQAGGRIFPSSNKAKDIVSALQAQLTKQKINIMTGHRVIKLSHAQSRLQSLTFEADGQLKTISVQAVIIATGGASYPQTGSTGDGYKLAQQLGHKIIPPLPALVPLVGNTKGQLQGLSLHKVGIKIYAKNKLLCQNTGDIIFTHFGLSGPGILDISAQAVRALNKEKKIGLSIDLFPCQNESQIDKILLEKFAQHGRKTLKSLLAGLIPPRVALYCLADSKLEPDLKVSKVTLKHRKNIIQSLKNIRFTINGHLGFKKAMLTSGGVDLQEIEAMTMHSKKIQGIFWAGEVMNINGLSGGFNIQAAFSTGYLAAESAAKFIQYREDK